MAYQPNPVPILCADIIRKDGNIQAHIAESFWRNKLYNEEVVPVPREYFKVQFNGLKDGVNTLCAMTGQIEELIAFVNLSPKSKEFESILGEEVEWLDSDSLNIGFKYIEEGFLKKLTTQIENILSGKQSYAEVFKYYTSESSLEDLDRNFYGSSIPRYIPLKHIGGRRNNVKTLILSDAVIKGTIGTFLEQLLYCNLNPASKYESVAKGNFKTTIDRVKSGFSTLYDALVDMNMSTLKGIDVSKIDVTGDQINTLFSYIFHAVFSIEGRIIILLYRLISASISNVRNVYYTYRIVTKRKNGLDTNVLEEVGDDEISDVQGLSLTNGTLMVQAARNLVSAVVNAYAWFDKAAMTRMLSKRSTVPFYVAVEKFFSVIDVRTRNMKCGFVEGGTQYEEEVPFSTILETYRLMANPDAYLQWIDEHCNPFEGDVCENDELPIAAYLADIGTFLTRIESDSRTLKCTTSRIATMKESIRNNTNNWCGFLTDSDHAIEWCDAMIEMLGKANVKFGWLFRKRLYRISEKLPICVPHVNDDIALDHGYFPLHSTDDVDVMVDYEESCVADDLYEINRKYAKLHQLKMLGMPYFEADETTSTKPVVHDSGNVGGNDAGNKKPENGNNAGEAKDANKTDTDQEEKTKSSGKIVDKIMAQLKKLREILDKLVSDGVKDKNLKFLSTNRDFLISRNYTNTSVDILPYIDNIQYDELLRGWIDKASQITDTTLRTGDEGAIRNAIFSGFSMPKGKDGIEDDLVHGLKVGTAELAVTSLSDNALKEKVPKMISFCEFYYNTLKDSLERIENENVKKLSALDGKKAGDGSETDRTEKNKALITQMLKSAVNAVRYASRDRCNDYLSILSSLASSNKKNKNEAPQQDNSSNEEKKA